MMSLSFPMVAVLPILALRLLRFLLGHAHGGHDLAALDRIVHYCLVACLLLPLDFQQRVGLDLGGHVPRRGRRLPRQEVILGLFCLLLFGRLDQMVDSPLAQEVSLAIFGISALAVRGTIVQPVDAVDSFPATCRLELALGFFPRPLFFELLDTLLGPLPLLEGFLLSFVHLLLVFKKGWMPRLFEIQVAAAHLCDVAVEPARESKCET
jgi:hypothetical protein